MRPPAMNFLSMLRRLGGLVTATCIGLGQALPVDFPTPVHAPGGIHLAGWQKPGEPAEAARPLPAAVRHKLAAGPLVRLEAPDLDPVLAEDARALSDAKGARRISLRRALPKALLASAGKGGGNWQSLPDGTSVWTAQVESEGALALRLHFSEVALPDGAEILVYGGSDEVTGPYSMALLAGRDQFWSGTVFAPRVTVECTLAPGVPVESVHFRIDELTHRYVALPLPDAAAKAAETCNVDVTCEPDWLTTSKAVAGLGSVQTTGELFCTGCLVNDANPATGTDYVMTANHCVGSQVEADTVEFYWFYQTAACNGAVPPLTSRPRTIGGADFIAGAYNELVNDFAFLRLRRPTPAGVMYAGWSSEPVASGSEIIGIHHPSGDFKRISFGNVSSTDGDYWRVQWSRGITEPGSSGSPLFTSNHEFIGQLYGGRSSCELPDGEDVYGRFDRTFPVISPWLLGTPAVATNDSFAKAMVISGLNGNLRGSTAGASKEAGEPLHVNNRGGKSVWFRWTAPSNTLVTFKTDGSAFDTLLAVYTGATVNALTAVRSNNDGLEYPLSALSFAATAGTNYLIALDGYDGAAGAFGLVWLPGATEELSSNDNFADAMVLSAGRGEVGVSNQGASKEPGEPNHAGNVGGASVWFRWVAPTTGKVFFDTEGSEIDTVLAIYGGLSLASLGTPIATADDINSTAEIYTSRTSFNAIAGKTYFIAVDGYGEEGLAADQGFILLTWYPPAATTGAPPANDGFSAAQLLPGNTGSTNGTTLRATKQPGEPDHAGTAGGRSIWYRWVASADGLVSFDTKGSDYDSVLAVYTGATVSSLALLGDNDDVDRSTRQSRVTVRTTAGTEYRAAVEAFLTDSGVLREGAVKLAWSFEPGGNNDNFAQAQLLTGTAGRVTGESWQATVEPDEPRHAGNRGGASVWYRWIAPATGNATFDTVGSTFDTVLGIYTGASVDALDEVGRGDDISSARSIYTSEATFPVVEAEEYHLAIDGYRSDSPQASPAEVGSIVVNWTFKAAPELKLLNPVVGPGGFSVSVTGGAGESVTLQTTGDFAAWTDVTSTTLDAGGAGSLSDPDATGRTESFYRVIRQ